MRLPQASLKLTVPLILLVFAAVLSAVNLVYHVPQAERVAEEDSRKRLAQELSRLQSTLEYLLLKGDLPAAQHEIEVLAHNHDVLVAALADDGGRVITATRRAWVERRLDELLPAAELRQAAGDIRARRAGMSLEADGNQLLGHAGVLLAGAHDELRPSRTGSLFLAYDLERYKAEARAQVVQQALYWAGWVTALALAMWAAFHVLLTRRTARLVHAAEQLAAGQSGVRSGLRGSDELGRLGRAFDVMAEQVVETQTRLRHDIAERVRVQHELEVSEASYRAIFDAAEDVILVHDLETGAIVDANPKACATFGYAREEFRHLDVGRLGSGTPPYTREDAMRLFARAVAGEQLHFEWHTRLRDGSLRWHEVFGKRVTIGGQDRILSLARDVTDRKLAEEALAASEEQYRAMFNASIDGLALWTAEGERVDTNPALRRMYGHAGDRAWAGPSYPPAFLRQVAQGEAQHVEVSGQRRDGTPLEIELHGIPMLYQGEPHVLTIARDVTEKKRQAEELARQRESLHQREKLAALGSLLAGVAHELNNPLSVVVARAVLLEEQGNAATRVAARKIRSAAERCARIVRTFLAMARQQQPQRGPVAIREVVHAALDIAGYALRNSGIELQLALAADLPPIHADADQLHQVLLNLILNAQQSLQEQPPPRRIRIAAATDASGQRLRVSVADNGPGIPPSLRARVFEPYFTTKPTGMGTGVGLAVSLGIVEAHGGTMTIETPSDGRGVVFVVALPLGPHEPAAADVAQAAAPPEPAPSARRILVVDDEAEVREALVAILTPLRHRVVAVGSGREALERLAAERYDAVITDMRMPDLDGRALYREIEQRWPAQAARVVFVTGDTLTAGLREFVVASGRPVLEKPFLPADVRRLVGELSAAED